MDDNHSKRPVQALTLEFSTVMPYFDVAHDYVSRAHYLYIDRR